MSPEPLDAIGSYPFISEGADPFAPCDEADVGPVGREKADSRAEGSRSFTVFRSVVRQMILDRTCRIEYCRLAMSSLHESASYTYTHDVNVRPRVSLWVH